jgi:hypothetical protein
LLTKGQGAYTAIQRGKTDTAKRDRIRGLGASEKGTGNGLKDRFRAPNTAIKLVGPTADHVGRGRSA